MGYFAEYYLYGPRPDIECSFAPMPLRRRRNPRLNHGCQNLDWLSLYQKLRNDLRLFTFTFTRWTWTSWSNGSIHIKEKRANEFRQSLDPDDVSLDWFWRRFLAGFWRSMSSLFFAKKKKEYVLSTIRDTWLISIDINQLIYNPKQQGQSRIYRRWGGGVAIVPESRVLGGVCDCSTNSAP